MLIYVGMFFFFLVVVVVVVVVFFLVQVVHISMVFKINTRVYENCKEKQIAIEVFSCKMSTYNVCEEVRANGEVRRQDKIHSGNENNFWTWTDVN